MLNYKDVALITCRPNVYCLVLQFTFLAHFIETYVLEIKRAQFSMMTI